MDLERRERFRETFIQKEWKDSDRLVIRAVPDEEFLYKKINNRDVYVDYGSTEDTPEDACSLRLDGNLTALSWSRWLKFQDQVLESINCKSNLVRFSLAVLLTFFRSLLDG